MTRTRRSIANASPLATQNEDIGVNISMSCSPTNNNNKQKNNKQQEALNAEAKYGSPIKNANNKKKRTVSDRSPAIKSRKRTPVQGTPTKQQQQSQSKDLEKYDHDTLEEKENCTPGPTPYWKVAEERGGMSPRLTRSAKKQPQPLESPQGNGNGTEVSRGLFQMEFSPSDPQQIRKMELHKEKERDERLKQKRRLEGDVSFLSPGPGSAKKNVDSSANANQFCLQLSPAGMLPVESTVTSIRPLSRASSVNSGITLNSAQVEELHARLHEMDKENASLRAENKMMDFNLNKVQQRYDDDTVKWDVKNQKLIIENAKLHGKLQYYLVPANDCEKWKAMDLKVEELNQELGEFRTERSKKQIDSAQGARFNDMDRQLARLQQSLAERDAQIKTQAQMHENALASVKKEIEEHAATKSEVDKCKRRLQEEKDAALDEVENVQKQLEDTRVALSQQNQREKELQLTLGSIDQGASKRNNDLEAEVAELCEINECNEKRIRDLDKQVMDVQQALTESEKKCVEIENDIVMTKEKLDDSEGRNAELESKMVKLVDENVACKREISILNAKLEKYENEMKKFTNQVNEIENERNNMELELNITKEEFGYLESELKTKLAKARSAIKAKDNGLAKITEKMTNFNARESDLLRQIVLQEEVRRSLHNKVIQLSGNIRVFVRVRPSIPSEEATAKTAKSPFSFPSVFDQNTTASSITSTSTVNVGDDLTKRFIVATEPTKDRGGLSQRRKKLKFGFDNVFTPTNTQDDVWEATEPLVQSAVDGYNTCVFAYGQTGSGKTYTMLGTSANKGIVTQAVKKLFGAKHMLEGTSQGQTTVEISVELLEVYNEQIRDLVSTKECDGSGAKKLNISLNSNEALGNTVHVATSEEEVSDILAIAQKRRCVKATKSNEESSRSHLIFTMNFIVRSSSGERRSKLHICDLAGSERLSKSQAVGSTLKETQHINKSLSTLSNVIEKLQQKSSHVPFRESKLTYLLRNSLGGDSKTLAIVCCNPLTEHFQETTCSLRFAQKLNKVELQAVGSISC